MLQSEEKPLVIESSTLHIALATYPKRKAEEYIAAVKASYIKFKTDFNNNFKPITAVEEASYSPLVYHIFGSYDVAFISVIDSDKFAQKLFLPEDKSNINTEPAQFSPHSYQILTGLCPAINDGFSLFEFHTKNRDKTFVNICNIKLNNGFLIGTGLELFNLVIRYIDYKIKESKSEEFTGCCYDYVLLQSFSWFEICLVLFDNTIKPISDIITNLRETTLNDLMNFDEEKGQIILEQCLYQNRKDYLNVTDEDIKYSHIFADTHSHFGVQYERFAREDPFTEEDQLITEIEYLVKPGHIGDLIEELEKIDSGAKKIFKTDETYFITGKSDYSIPETIRTSFENNHQFFIKLRQKEDNKILDYIRGVKTRPLFSFQKPKPNSDSEKGILNFSDVLKDFSISLSKQKKIDLDLKSLKVSRPIRQKISKVIFNYNNGINDPVLFLYFLDFRILIHQLIYLVKDSVGKFDENFLDSDSKFHSVDSLEITLDDLLKVFEEGYHVRMLNCYQFEEIYDFDLDLNSSLAQLLTTYNTLVTEVTNIHLPNYINGQVVQVNLQNTVSNRYGINYNVYHLSLPEFILFTITKEIFNPMREIEAIKNSGYFNQLDTLIHNNPHLSSLQENELLDIDYLINDIIRCIYVCNFDINLHDFWIWTDALQTSSHYDSLGSFKERNFTAILFRNMLLRSIIDKDSINDIKCPIPELANYWYKHFSNYKTMIIEIGEDKNSKFLELISKIYMIIIDQKVSNERSVSCSFTDDENRKIEQISEKINIYSQFPVDEKTTLKAYFNSKIRNQYTLYPEFSTKITNGNTLKFPYSMNGQLLSKKQFIYGLAYTYLRQIFEKNEGKIYFLRRDWKDGSIHPYFNQKDSKLYTIDPMGGVFFFDKENAKDYHKMRNAVLESLWHFALVTKKDFIDHQYETD
jgi:hypothetical protein